MIQTKRLIGTIIYSTNKTRKLLKMFCMFVISFGRIIPASADETKPCTQWFAKPSDANNITVTYDEEKKTCTFQCASGYFGIFELKDESISSNCRLFSPATYGTIETYTSDKTYDISGTGIYFIDSELTCNGDTSRTGNYCKCPDEATCNANGNITNCTDGYYINNNSCTQCPNGYECADGGKKVCPANYYCSDGKKTACPASHPTSHTGSAAITNCYNDKIPTGYFIAYSLSEDEAEGCTLIEGTTYYCPCPAGYYCPGTKINYVDNHLHENNGANPCEYKKGQQDNANNIIKWVGGYTNPGTNQLVTGICPLASESKNITQENITITADWKSNQTGNSTCYAKYTITTPCGTIVKESVPADTAMKYTTWNDAAKESLGSTAYYNSLKEGLYAANLLNDRYCTNGTNRKQYFTRAYACPAGKYCNGYTEAPACPPNSDPLQYGINGDISAGYYSLGGAWSQAPASSKYCYSGQCGPCPAGYYCTPATKTQCEAGYYCPERSTTQTECKTGKYCPAGSATENDCQAGQYCQSPAYTATCPDGKYCPAGTVSPITCPAGNYCIRGSETYTQCTAGHYCPAGVSTPKDCGTGHYCPAGASTPTTCPAGQYCPTTTTATPTDCSAGNYCPSGSSSQTQCPKGNYCPAKSAAPTICDAGYYCPDVMMSTPLKCDPGHYCPSGCSSQITCPAGYYCESGSAQGELCQAGDYCPAGATQGTKCPAGSTSTSGMSVIDSCYLHNKTRFSTNTDTTNRAMIIPENIRVFYNGPTCISEFTGNYTGKTIDTTGKPYLDGLICPASTGVFKTI